MTSQNLFQHKFIALEIQRKNYYFFKSILLIIALLFHVVAPIGAVLFGQGALHSLSFLRW